MRLSGILGPTLISKTRLNIGKSIKPGLFRFLALVLREQHSSNSLRPSASSAGTNSSNLLRPSASSAGAIYPILRARLRFLREPPPLILRAHLRILRETICVNPLRPSAFSAGTTSFNPLRPSANSAGAIYPILCARLRFLREPSPLILCAHLRILREPTYPILCARLRFLREIFVKSSSASVCGFCGNNLL